MCRRIKTKILFILCFTVSLCLSAGPTDDIVNYLAEFTGIPLDTPLEELRGQSTLGTTWEYHLRSTFSRASGDTFDRAKKFTTFIEANYGRDTAVLFWTSSLTYLPKNGGLRGLAFFMAFHSFLYGETDTSLILKDSEMSWNKKYDAIREAITYLDALEAESIPFFQRRSYLITTSSVRKSLVSVYLSRQFHTLQAALMNRDWAIDELSANAILSELQKANLRNVTGPVRRAAAVLAFNRKTNEAILRARLLSRDSAEVDRALLGLSQLETLAPETVDILFLVAEDHAHKDEAFAWLLCSLAYSRL